MISIGAHILGLIGMSLVVYAFYQTVSGKWSSQGEHFNVVNLSGAILLLLSLLVHFNLGSFVIEIFWIAISIKGLRQLYVKGHSFAILKWFRMIADRIDTNYGRINKS